MSKREKSKEKKRYWMEEVENQGKEAERAKENSLPQKTEKEEFQRT